MKRLRAVLNVGSNGQNILQVLVPMDKLIVLMETKISSQILTQPTISLFIVTRLGDLLDLWQLFKAFGNNKSPTFLGNFCKGVKIIFLVKSILGNFYRYLAIFSGHTDCDQCSMNALHLVVQ